MSQPLFSIRHLICAYDRNVSNKVLKVDSLDIPRGEVIFLLGSSGSGKSTLLEALGLMNNTVASGEILFHPTEKEEGINLANLWKPENALQAAEIRKRNYSFIFQNTNLMENFTAYENICLSRMIQDNVVQDKAMAGAKTLMSKVGLPESQVGIDTLSINLSGGQKQRVAFVRALNSECSVLFGDEPTGNLDEGNANELMQVVREYIGDKVSAIVVSHDINLALNHANRIVCISRNGVDGCGEILEQNIFERKQWQNFNAHDLQEFRAKLKEFYIRPTVTVGEDTANAAINRSFEKGFTKLFLQKEGAALAGKKFLNLIVLAALMFFTFLAIGFANGTIAYLEKKINNPFVLWLTVTIPHSKGSEEVDKIKRELNSEPIKEQFRIKHVTSYVEMPLVFWSKTDSTFISVKSRSIEMSSSTTDPMLSEIVSNRNNLTPGPNNTNGFRNFKDLSVIVTKRLMQDFGYNLTDRFIDMEYPIRNDSTGEPEYKRIPVGIRAVVEEIPGKIQAAYSIHFYRSFNQNQDGAFDTRNKKNICFYLPGEESEAKTFGDDLERILATLPKYQRYNPEVSSPAINRYAYKDGFELDIAFFPNPENYLTLDSLYIDVSQHPDYKKYLNKVIRIYDYYNANEDFQQTVNSDELSINFSDLEKVRDFAGYILKKQNDREEMRGGGIIEVDTGKVTEKENFNFLSKITRVISIILILFCTISVSLFIFNLLKMHLTKVKMNIGTFQAFGLSNARAQGIYFFIIIRFVLFSIVGALVLAYLVGFGLDKILPYYITVEDKISYFKLFDWFTGLTLVLILVTALGVSWVTIRNMLSKSPGDLIYNR